MVTADRFGMIPTSREDRLRLALIGAAIILGLFLYSSTIANLWHRWGSQEELSHSYFIPVISGWLVWTNRDKVLKSVGQPAWAGIAIIIAAVLVYIVGLLIESFLFRQLSLVIAIAGATAAFGGLSLLKTTAAPIAFLLLAVPPPHMVINILSWRFQEISSVLGVMMLQAVNVPVFLSGNIIDLGDYKLQVAEACSGLRYLFPFLSLGVMSAYIYRGPLWHKAIIVLSTIPITIFMNSFRIGVTGLFVQAYGPQHAEGALHFFEGWVVFLLCLVALFAVVAALAFISKPRKSVFEALGSPDLPEVAPSQNSGTSGAQIIGGTLVAIAAATLVITQVLGSENLVVPDRKTFVELPAEFTEWNSEVRDLEPWMREAIGADDTTVFDMTNDKGEVVNLYLAYIKARRDGRSWHSPQQCIPGGGWGITQLTIENTTTPSGVLINYNRMIIENRGARYLVYYWYPQRGRHIANEIIMRMWLTYDAVAKNRADGAMIRLMTPITDRGEEDAERILQDLIDELDPILPDYVPIVAQRG